MLRKLALVVSFACLVFVAAMIVSCGSSKTHLGTMCTGGPFNVVGDWQGTIATSTGNQEVTGVINTQGQAVFFDSDSLNSDPASGSVAVCAQHHWNLLFFRQRNRLQYAGRRWQHYDRLRPGYRQLRDLDQRYPKR